MSELKNEPRYKHLKNKARVARAYAFALDEMLDAELALGSTNDRDLRYNLEKQLSKKENEYLVSRKRFVETFQLK